MTMNATTLTLIVNLQLPEGYGIHCAAGDWVMIEESELKWHIVHIEGECEKRGLTVA